MTESITQQGLEPIEVSELNSSGNSLLNSSSVNSKQLTPGGKQFTPVSRREFATANGVTPAYVGKLVKQLQAVWEPIDQQFQALTTDDKITSSAQSELLVMMDEKPAKYRQRLWEEYGFDPQAKAQQVTQPPAQSSALVHAPGENEFGLTVRTKASARLTAIQAEIVESEKTCESDLSDFLALSTEMEFEEQAAEELDDAEFALLRKKHAQKWLKRRAILERDKQQILQGELPQLKRG